MVTCLFIVQEIKKQKEKKKKIKLKKISESNYTIIYLLSRKEREEMYEFIEEQLRKKYIRLSKSSQIVIVFFIRKKDSKK